MDSLNSALGQGFIHRVSGTGAIGSLVHDGKVNIKIRKEAPLPPPHRYCLAGCDPQVEARINIKSKPDKNLNKANEILQKINQKWDF
jgi:hypothetical protein